WELSQGGSTITQQLAKNLFLETERTYGRKLKEAVLTYRLEKALSKKRILELYLNVIEWGDGVYGAEAAARAVLGKSAADLDAVEGALLAAMIPNPRRLDPCERPKSVRARQERILRWMYRAKRLTEEEYQIALEERLWLPNCGSFPREG
ncbi:MAG: transglycosylase domain-containing protein, partial [Vicinamibacteria bacterium]